MEGPAVTSVVRETVTSEDVLQEVLDSILVRWKRGERPALEDYEARYPHLAPRLRELFPALVLLGRLPLAGTGPQGHGSLGPGGPPVLYRLGPFRLVRVIGRGGMGIVFDAEDESLHRRVAVKVLPFHGTLDPKRIERFHREAQAAGALHHPGIVPVYGAGEEQGLHYYAMQFIEGDSLDSILDEVRRWTNGEVLREDTSRTTQLALRLLSDSSSSVHRVDWSVMAVPADLFAATVVGTPPPGPALTPEYYRAVARIAWQVSQSLAHAHGHGVLHRDIKPGNILLDTAGNAWITDFGLARLETAEKLTGTGEILGTLRYMAPECFRGSADPRSDIYSLGLTLHELLTLEAPFGAEEVRRGGTGGAAVARLSIRQRRFGVPRPLERIVLKATQDEPLHRYQSACEVAVDLERFLEGRPVYARLPGAAMALQGFLRRRRRWLAAALAVAVMGAGFMGLEATAHHPRAPQCAVLADCDSDGDVDIAIANGSPSSLTVLRNEGQGRFEPAGHFQVGAAPRGVAWGDFDGDGSNDLVTSSLQSNALTILAAGGEPSFTRGKPLAVGIPTVRVSGADVDGDGSVDILATTRDNRIAIFKGGRGEPSLSTFITTLNAPGNLAVGDLDWDGDLDLAVASMADSTGANVAVHRNRGPGQLPMEESYDVGGSVRGLKISDLDQDGDLDLAICFDSLPQVTILWNDGSAAYPGRTDVPLPAPAAALAASDLDGDNDQDLAVVSETGYVGILKNGGGRSLVFLPQLPAGGQPTWLEIGDLDGNGTPDLAVTNKRSNDLTLFFNDGRGSFGARTAIPLFRWWRPLFLK